MWTLLLACQPTPSPSPPPPDPVPAPPPAPVAPPEPVFESTVRPLTDEEKASMTGVTWRPGCPVGLDDLVLVEASHHDFDGEIQTGHLVVAASVADAVVGALQAAFDEGYPIQRMEPAVAYDGSDQRSMDANNTSAFNCRAITGGTSYSEHSYGHALDVNPVQNPYISASGRTVLPAAARAYQDRDDRRPGMLFADSALVQHLVAAGWGWGGTWSRTRDYQHLSETGR